MMIVPSVPYNALSVDEVSIPLTEVPRNALEMEVTGEGLDRGREAEGLVMVKPAHRGKRGASIRKNVGEPKALHSR